jgi:NAD(P)-dependent dehydrogenase (short-subunit alcohol dehydrogenase family)
MEAIDELPDISDRWSLGGRLAVVTGGGRGLGRGCALALAEAGAAVVVVSRTAADVDAVVAEIADTGGVAHGRALDVTDEDAVARLFADCDRLGGASVLVNSAGTNRPGPAAEYAVADWDALFAVNVRATFLTCRAFGAAALDRGDGGAVVNLSSQMGTVGYPGRSAYCATKHAVEGLTKALGVEWAPNGIRVNAVAPTVVLTPLTEKMLADPAFEEEVRRRIPSGRLATVEQVADAVRYLACDASGSVTGTVLRVDGGWTAW